MDDGSMSDSDDDLLEEQRTAIRESCDLLTSSKRKPDWEREVCCALLREIGVDFEEGELASPDVDPPDVNFRDASFEVKELLDDGRRRDDEYKDAVRQADSATSFSDLSQIADNPEMSLAGVMTVVGDRLEDLRTAYGFNEQASFDLVFYFNLQVRVREVREERPVGPLSSPALVSCRYRSVSVYANSFALVLDAKEDAPEFLRRRKRTLWRNGRQLALRP